MLTSRKIAALTASMAVTSVLFAAGANAAPDAPEPIQERTGLVITLPENLVVLNLGNADSIQNDSAQNDSAQDDLDAPAVLEEELSSPLLRVSLGCILFC